LLFALVDAERQRVLDRSLNHIPRAPGRPIRLSAEVVVNQIKIEPRCIRADRVVAVLPGVGLPLPLGEGWGEGFRRMNF
jgi:hypothetical protein